jgi:hypothetical protein
MMICLNCGNDFRARRGAKCCSAKCRVAYNRNKSKVVNVTDVTLKSSVTRPKTGPGSQPLPGDTDYEGVCYQDDDGKWQVREDETDPKQMSRSMLQAKINSYPGDTWKHSPEMKELMRRLHKYSIARLESEGYAIPAWKTREPQARHEGTQPVAGGGTSHYTIYDEVSHVPPDGLARAHARLEATTGG